MSKENSKKRKISQESPLSPSPPKKKRKKCDHKSIYIQSEKCLSSELNGIDKDIKCGSCRKKLHKGRKFFYCEKCSGGWICKLCFEKYYL